MQVGWSDWNFSEIYSEVNKKSKSVQIFLEFLASYTFMSHFAAISINYFPSLILQYQFCYYTPGNIYQAMFYASINHQLQFILIGCINVQQYSSTLCRTPAECAISPMTTTPPTCYWWLMTWYLVYIHLIVYSANLPLTWSPVVP